MNNIIECKSLNKKFRWYERSKSLKEGFTKLFKSSAKKWEWDVLKNINFEIEHGEKVGIIGRNGCGKSSLLKIVTGIYHPTSGRVINNSKKMLALIELGVGFYPELTGRENIKLNWVFNGLPKSELKNKFDDIVNFSGVKNFLDTPLKYYSSGMVSRLGFSVAIHAEPDLLIIDEALSVGDSEFQDQCYRKIEEICDSGTTIILVSHNLSDIERVCQRTIWIDKGAIAFDGLTEGAIELYKKSMKIIPEKYEAKSA